MPDGTPMHRPCSCLECSDGPGVNYEDARLSRVLGMMEADRAERRIRQQQLRERLYGNDGPPF